MLKLLCFLVTLTGCSLKQPDPKVSLPMEELKAAQEKRIAQALSEFDDGLKRLAPILDDCDGMIWQGQWCSVAGCSLTDYRDDQDPGRFYRRPDPRCWDGKPQGSATTWSRDMFVCGLLPYALIRENLEYLKSHQAYGEAHGWYLGEPKADGRAYYNPQIRALLAKAVEHLGGDKDNDTLWPTIYPSGLSDYQAHLQVCNIWARGIIEGKIHSMMLDRVFEHYKRVPDDPFYSVVYAIYSGKTGKAVENCLKEEPFTGDYVRCGNHGRACGFAHQVFACQILMDAYD